MERDQVFFKNKNANEPSLDEALSVVFQHLNGLVANEKNTLNGYGLPCTFWKGVLAALYEMPR